MKKIIIYSIASLTILLVNSCYSLKQNRQKGDEVSTQDSSSTFCLPTRELFVDFEKKMVLNHSELKVKKKNKINLIIFDAEPVQQVSENVKTIGSGTSSGKTVTHSDKAIKVINSYSKDIVNITHIYSPNQHTTGSVIGYVDELQKMVKKNKTNGDIVFFIMNASNKSGPIDLIDDVFKNIKELVKQNMVVIESAGNDDFFLEINPNQISDAIVVGGAKIDTDEKGIYKVADCTNHGERIDIYGPSCVESFNGELFCQTSSGSAVITALAVLLQFECSKSLHKYLTSEEMKDIFKNAPSDLKVNELGKKVPQYDKLLKYAQVTYFAKKRKT